MGQFRVIISKNAILDIKKHLKSGNKSTIKKIETILIELENHPTTGVGQPEQLKFEFAGKWSRRLNQKDRMVYSIDDDTVVVEVLSAMGHYLDK
jgi:toxin YoeB